MGLSGAGLRNADYVLALYRKRDRLKLNRCRDLKLYAFKDVKDLRRDTQPKETPFRGCAHMYSAACIRRLRRHHNLEPFGLCM